MPAEADAAASSQVSPLTVALFDGRATLVVGGVGGEMAAIAC